MKNVSADKKSKTYQPSWMVGSQESNLKTQRVNQKVQIRAYLQNQNPKGKSQQNFIQKQK